MCARAVRGRRFVKDSKVIELEARVYQLSELLKEANVLLNGAADIIEDSQHNLLELVNHLRTGLYLCEDSVELELHKVAGMKILAKYKSKLN